MQHHQFNQIGIIGAGELGKAIGQALTATARQVLYYDRDMTRTTTANIEDVVRTCQVLLICVPSWAIRDVTKQISRAAHPGQPKLVICFSKGVEPGFVTMDDSLHKRLPKFYDFGVLYGPMIAEELMRGRPATGVLALSSNSWFAQLRRMFSEAHIYIEASGDMRGLALCAVLKNIYAIAFGICDGLHLGLNVKGKLAVMAVQEMKQILSDRKADPRTAEGLAGIGDLLATGFSDDSFNYRVGKSLAERIADEHIKSEGLVTLFELGRIADIKRYPIAAAVDQIVFHYAKPDTLADLLTK